MLVAGHQCRPELERERDQVLIAGIIHGQCRRFGGIVDCPRLILQQVDQLSPMPPRDALGDLRVGEHPPKLLEKGRRDEQLELSIQPSSNQLSGRTRCRQGSRYEHVGIEDYRQLVHRLQNGFTPVHLLDDLLGRRRPHEWLGVVVVSVEELLDRLDQVGDRVKDAAADRLVGQCAEEAFDEVQPRA